MGEEIKAAHVITDWHGSVEFNKTEEGHLLTRDVLPFHLYGRLRILAGFWAPQMTMPQFIESIAWNSSLQKQPDLLDREDYWRTILRVRFSKRFHTKFPFKFIPRRHLDPYYDRLIHGFEPNPRVVEEAHGLVEVADLSIITSAIRFAQHLFEEETDKIGVKKDLTARLPFIFRPFPWMNRALFKGSAMAYLEAIYKYLGISISVYAYDDEINLALAMAPFCREAHTSLSRQQAERRLQELRLSTSLPSNIILNSSLGQVKESIQKG